MSCNCEAQKKLERIKARINNMQWIDLDAEQPEEMEQVLCYCWGGRITSGKYYGKEFCERLGVSGVGRKHFGKYGRWFDLAKDGYKVTHWMKLPEPPQLTEGK